MNLEHNLIEDNIIILSKQTLDEMLKKNKPSDLIGLYCFYYYTAKWQRTNIIKCSTGYVMKGLNWSKEKTIESKKELKEMGFIDDKKTKNEKGQITGWYIKINYIWKKETIKNQKVASPEGGFSHPVANPDTNALSANSLNALSANNIAPQTVQRKDQDIIDMIELFKGVNPNYERLFGNKTQRSAIERMIKKQGREKVEGIINTLPETNGKQYAPVITTPLQLENKLGDLIIFIKKNKNNNKFVNLDEKYE